MIFKIYEVDTYTIIKMDSYIIENVIQICYLKNISRKILDIRSNKSTTQRLIKTFEETVEDPIKSSMPKR